MTARLFGALIARAPAGGLAWPGTWMFVAGPHGQVLHVMCPRCGRLHVRAVADVEARDTLALRCACGYARIVRLDAYAPPDAGSASR